MSQVFDFEHLGELCRRTQEETQHSEDFRETVADFGYPTERVVTCRADFADTVCRIGKAVFPYVKTDDELPTVGIVLCGRKNDAGVELTLPEEANIYASKYQLYLPSKRELVAQLERVQRELNFQESADGE